MSVQERAKRLVGDMPWVTERMDSLEILDLIAQIATSMEAAVKEAVEHDRNDRLSPSW